MSTYAQDKEETGTPSEKLLEKAKRCARQAWAAEADQRKREIQALKFQVGEFQWDDAAKQARAGGVSGGVVTPPRPMLAISKLDQPIQLVLNQARAAKLGVKIHPVSADANDDTAEVLQGLYNRIQRDSHADQARLWALDRATKCGRGVYRVNTKFDEDAPEGSFDQEIVIERILNQDSVYFDPSAQKPDFSDGDWAFESLWMTPDRFEREFPGAKFPINTPVDFEGLARSEPEWVKGSGDDRKILVIVYWYKQHDVESVTRESDGQKFKRDNVSVKRCWLTALEVLEEEDWNGKLIPLIPTIGRELQPFDGERRWVGMVEPAMDAQRFHNYAATSLVERMALEPKVPFIGYEGQFTDQGWPHVNTRNIPFIQVPVKPDGAGGTLPLPQRSQLDQTGMSMAVTGVEMSNDWIQGVTGVYDPSLGRQNPRDKSGRAILALQQQADAGNNHYLASLADTSLPYEARVVLDLIPVIYDRPGRITRILGEEDDVQSVMLNAPFKLDMATGRPIPAAPDEQGAKNYNFAEGRYTVSAEIGKSHQTAMQEGQDEIGAILQADPSLMPLIGATYFRYRDFPGSKEIADILKKVRDKQIPDLDTKPGEQPTPEQAQAQMQAMGQQMQVMQAQLQQAMQMIETEKVKNDAMLQKAQLEGESKLAIAKMEQETAAHQDALKLTIEKMNIAFEEMKMKFEAAHEVGLEAAKARTMTVKRDMGQETGQEREDESSQGGRSETMPERPEAEA